MELAPVEKIESKIFQIRGKRVMLDRDLRVRFKIPIWKPKERCNS